MRHGGAFNKSFRPNSNNASHAQRKAVSHRPMARVELITNGGFTQQQNPEGQKAGPRPQPPSLTNGAFATPKQQGPEGRTGPAGHGPQCLTSLSEPTRKLAAWAVFQPPKAPQTAPSPQQKTAGPWRTDRACGPRPPVPNVTFWTYKKTSCLSCLPAAKSLTNGAFATPKQQGPEGRTGPAGHGPQCLTSLSEPTRRTSCLSSLPAAKSLTNGAFATQTAGAWGTDRACGPRPPVPKVTFWTYKKTSCLSCLPAAKSLTNGAFATPKQQGPEGRTGPAGHGPQCLTSLSEPTRKLAVWAVFQPPKASQTAPSPHKQQGPEGRTGPAGHGPQCRTSLSEPTRKLAVWAVKNQQGPEGRTGPAGHGPQCLTSLSEPKEN